MAPNEDKKEKTDIIERVENFQGSKVTYCKILPYEQSSFYAKEQAFYARLKNALDEIEQLPPLKDTVDGILHERKEKQQLIALEELLSEIQKWLRKRPYAKTLISNFSHAADEYQRNLTDKVSSHAKRHAGIPTPIPSRRQQHKTNESLIYDLLCIPYEETAPFKVTHMTKWHNDFGRSGNYQAWLFNEITEALSHGVSNTLDRMHTPDPSLTLEAKQVARELKRFRNYFYATSKYDRHVSPAYIHELTQEERKGTGPFSHALEILQDLRHRTQDNMRGDAAAVRTELDVMIDMLQSFKGHFSRYSERFAYEVPPPQGMLSFG